MRWDPTSARRRWLHPAQFVQLIAWLAPRERAWAEAYAVGLYLHLRPGELIELRVKDLDLVAGEVRIERAFRKRTKEVKTPKTDEGVRTVTIPATLRPLLERIARERATEDLVCPIVASTNAKTHPTVYRDFLLGSGIDAPGYFVESATHLMIDFRSLRDSGITWRFLAGERAEVVQREAGHEHISTTLDYAKEVQDRRGRYGEPFPTLPEELTTPTEGASFGPGFGPADDDPSGIVVEAPGIEPCWAAHRKQAMVLVFHPNMTRFRRFSPAS